MTGLSVQVAQFVIRQSPPTVQYFQADARRLEIGVAACAQTTHDFPVSAGTITRTNPDRLERYDSDVKGGVISSTDCGPIVLRRPGTTLQDPRQFEKPLRIHPDLIVASNDISN